MLQDAATNVNANNKDKQTTGLHELERNELDLHVHGLNRSFSEALQAAIKANPIRELVPLFEQYTRHLAQIKAKYSSGKTASEDKTSSFLGTSAPTNGTMAFNPGQPVFESKPFVVLPSGSAPQHGTEQTQEDDGKEEIKSSGSLFSQNKAGEATKQSGLNPNAKPFSFAFNQTANQSQGEPKSTGFSNAASNLNSESQGKVPFAFGQTEQSFASKPQLFSPLGDSARSEASKETGSKLTFGQGKSNDGSEAKPSPFTFKSNANDNKEPQGSDSSLSETKPSVAFGTTFPGQTSAGPSTNPFASVSSSFGFGFASDKPTAAPSFGFNVSSDKPSTLAFGSSDAQKPFSFGQTQTEATSKPAPFQFSFSAPLPSFAIDTSATGDKKEEPILIGDEDEDAIPAGEEESFSNQRTNTELIKTGAGEESETCLMEQRCKLFTYEKERGWTDLGIGIFKINQGAEGKSRILIRTEGSGKILLNSWINPNMEVHLAEGKKEIDLLCVNQDAKVAKYLVRYKDNPLANEVYQKIQSLK